MSGKKRAAKISLKSEGLVGVITNYELDERKWEFLGMFDGNNVYKLKQKKEWVKEDNNTNS